MISVNGTEIPKLHLEQVPDSATTIKLSEVFGDFRIIPLETKKECLIMNTQMGFTGHSIVISTQQGGLGPCRVLEFGMDGKYIKEFGRGGKGPGEHGGYMTDEISWYQEKREVFISFLGTGHENQVFGEDGKYLAQVTIPVDLTQGIKKFNDTLWMTPGNICGNPEFRRDSLRLFFYTASGREVKAFPRTIYPPAGRRGYSPHGWGTSLYKYLDQWQIYLPGDDTIYRLGPDRLDPLAIINPGPKGARYNQWVDPASIIGTYSLKILSESKLQWFLEKTVIAKADIHEYGPGSWGGMYTADEFLLVVDKKTGNARNIRFEDDFLGLTRNNNNRQFVSWSENGEPYMIIMALELKESIKNSLKKEDLDPAIRRRLEQLDGQVTEDSNPVIVLMKVQGD